MTTGQGGAAEMPEAPRMDEDMRAWRNEAEIVIAGALVREGARLRDVSALSPGYATSAREVAMSIVQALEWRELVIVGGPSNRALAEPGAPGAEEGKSHD